MAGFGRLVVTVGAFVGIGVCVPAEADAQGLVTQKALSMEMAQTIVQATVDQCRKDGFRVSVTVVDGSGLLKAFVRDEGTAPHTIDLSRRKAYTALTFASRFPTSLAFATARGSTLPQALRARPR